jgi:hypothetical protein
MLVHAALEYLAWVTYVLNGKCSRKKYREAPAEDRLRDLLKDAGIDPAIPSGLQALQRFAQEERLADGPAALTRLRNRLVHPKYAGEPYHIEGLVTEAWRLSTEYGELLLLGRIGYRGKYLPRTNMGQWVDSIPVPWTI